MTPTDVSAVPPPSPRSFTVVGAPRPDVAMRGWLLLAAAFVIARVGAGLSPQAGAALQVAVAPLLALVGVVQLVQARRQRNTTRLDTEDDGKVLLVVEVVRGGPPELTRHALLPDRMLVTQHDGVREWAVLVQNDRETMLLPLPRETARRRYFLDRIEALVLPSPPPIPRGEPGALS